jgi:hypothetical protein
MKKSLMARLWHLPKMGKKKKNLGLHPAFGNLTMC